MKNKPSETFKAECGKIAINIEGNYTIIVDEDLNKYVYNNINSHIHTHNKNGVITVYIYDVV